MKGATAVPSASTIKPPKTSSISTIGTSQNFFRTRRKSHSSLRIYIRPRSTVRGRSELPLHGFRSRRQRGTRDPIAFEIVPPGERQHVPPPHDPGDWRDTKEEDRTHDQGARQAV